MRLSKSSLWCWCVLGAGGLLGCDPVFAVRGQIRSPADAGARPIEGATVVLQCPAVTTTLGTTDARGEFEFMSGGLMNPACNVIVSKVGLASRTISVAEACSSTFMGSCDQAVVSAELAPLPAGNVVPP